MISETSCTIQCDFCELKKEVNFSLLEVLRRNKKHINEIFDGWTVSPSGKCCCVQCNKIIKQILKEQ